MIRIIEQGTNYGQGDCVKGAYCVTGVSMKKITRPKPEIEKDIPEWKTSVTESLGNDSIAGTAIMLSEISDDTLMELVEKHFNAVTFGNELKPDALFNYQIDGNSVPTKTITFEGEELQVPVVNDAGDSLDFSRADAWQIRSLSGTMPIRIRRSVSADMCWYGIHRHRNGSSMRTMILQSHM